MIYSLTTEARSGVHVHSARRVLLRIAEHNNNSETLLPPAASDGCSATKELAGGLN